MGDKFWIGVGRALGVGLRLLALFAPVLYVITNQKKKIKKKKKSEVIYYD